MGLFSKLFKKSNDAPADQATATPTDTPVPTDATPVTEAPTPETPQSEVPAPDTPTGQDPNNTPAA